MVVDPHCSLRCNINFTRKEHKVKRLNTKRLKTAYSLISALHKENTGMTFELPGLLQYCLETDLRIMLREKKYTDTQIDHIIDKSRLCVLPLNAGKNRIRFKLGYRNFENFHEQFVNDKL